MTYQKKLVIKGNQTQPAIHFDGYNGILEMKGRSIPENSVDFYTLLINWADNYKNSPQPITRLDIKLDYCNSFTKKFIIEFLKKIKLVQEKGSKLQINWYYEYGDDEMQETGTVYSKLLNININTVEADPESST